MRTYYGAQTLLPALSLVANAGALAIVILCVTLSDCPVFTVELLHPEGLEALAKKGQQIQRGSFSDEGIVGVRHVNSDPPRVATDRSCYTTQLAMDGALRELHMFDMKIGDGHRTRHHSAHLALWWAYSQTILTYCYGAAALILCASLAGIFAAIMIQQYPKGRYLAACMSAVAFSWLLFASTLALGLAWSVTVITDLIDRSEALVGNVGNKFLALTWAATALQMLTVLLCMYSNTDINQDLPQNPRKKPSSNQGQNY